MTRQQVPNYELARDTARANLLVNGGFEIWQRGNGPFAVSGLWGPDRWSISLPYTSTLSVSRDAVNTDGLGVYGAVLTYVGPGSGPARLMQLIEGYANNFFANRMLSFSIRVKTSVAATARPIVFTGAAYVTGTTHTGDGTWQTLTWTGQAAANTTGGLYFGIECFGANATVYIDNAMLVVGSQAADYAPLHPADDLVRCLRYYEVHGGVTNTSIRSWWAGGAQNYEFPVGIVQKAVTPTVTKNGTWNVTNTAQPTAGSPNLFMYTWMAAASASGYCRVYADTSDDSITIEANP